MIAVPSPELLSAVVAAAVHHFALGADGAGASVWSFAGLWHAMTTVIVPAALVAVSLVLMLFTPPPSRASANEHDRPPVMMLSSIHGPGGPGDGERRQSERQVEQPVTRFYRVTFADERTFRMWTERVVELAAVVRDMIGAQSELRPVIFVPLRPSAAGPLQGYVSAGARSLATRITGGATLDPQPVSAAQLPRGLTMLVGEGVDAAEYEKHYG